MVSYRSMYFHWVSGSIHLVKQHIDSRLTKIGVNFPNVDILGRSSTIVWIFGIPLVSLGEGLKGIRLLVEEQNQKEKKKKRKKLKTDRDQRRDRTTG